METTFAVRVRMFRKSKGLSQDDFAKQCVLTQGNIAQMENGTEPKQSNVSKLVSGFPDLNPDWLLTGAGSMLRDGKTLTPTPGLTSGPATVAESENVLKLAVAEAKLTAQAQTIADQAQQIERLWAELGKSPGSADAAGPAPVSPLSPAQQAALAVSFNAYIEAQLKQAA